MRNLFRYSTLIFTLVYAIAYGQSINELSNSILQSELKEEEKLDSLLSLTKNQVRMNTDSGRVAAKILLWQSEKFQNDNYRGDALHYIGVSYAWQGNYEMAMDYYNQALKAYEINKDPGRMSLIHTSIGGVYFDQNKYLENLDYWLLAKSYSEKGDDKKRTETCNNNLGVLYLRIGKDQEAKALFEENLALGLKNGWVVSAGYAYINLAGIYLSNNQLDTAELYARKSFEIHEKVGNERQAASVLQDLSEIEFRKGNKELGLKYALQMVDEMKRLKDDFNYNSGKVFLGEKYLYLKEYQKAVSNCASAYESALKIESLGLQKSACKCLSKAYYYTGEHKKAYEYEMRFQELEDSILNDNVSLDLAKREFEFGYQLKAEKDSLEQARISEIQELEHQSEIKRQRNLTYFGLILAAILLMLTLYVFRNFQKKKKVNREILLSKEIIEVKNKEITDSINYAKRIQTAMLPSASHCADVLKDFFVFYEPKDIVAGDFYWVKEKNEVKYFAVADCTGHGVPGAMMSVVCNNALNRSLREFDLSDPGEILNKTRELVIAELNKGNDEKEIARSIKDGMDIALVRIEQEQEQLGRGSVAQADSSGWPSGKGSCLKLSYAGAYNSLFIVRLSKEINASGEVNIRSYGDLNLIELKADKQPVGIGHSKKDFTTKRIVLEPDDMIYAFSDGYADQFGNASQIDGQKNTSYKPQGKKFKSSNLKKLLVKISKEPVQVQQTKLAHNFESWKGDIEQLDDVCVIGVRV